MKWLLVLLVLANAGFYAYSQWVPEQGSTQELPAEVNADRLRVVDASTITPAPTVAPSPGTASDVAQAATASAVAAITPTGMPQAAVCLRWTVPSPEQAVIAAARMAALHIASRTLQSAEQAKVWVYVPPLADEETARRKAEELQGLGIDDYFVVNNGGRWQNAVSLGVYSTREAAERRLAMLKDKGVRSAVLRERDDTLRPASFLLSDVTEAQRAQLERSNRQLRGAQLIEAACR
ncbi:SPOR domain-containing protein [Chitinolyticbacter albus]|uniref:SPOR domain-containing protein n=1 Tax=Chitinolyticbacter albus TaxID=2961951 RepID=UPI00210CB382|nr:SPOR domain-containing protein [Chitinolyticbacter albus]